jgi:hypothetical protein
MIINTLSNATVIKVSRQATPKCKLIIFLNAVENTIEPDNPSSMRHTKEAVITEKKHATKIPRLWFFLEKALYK